MSSCQTGADRAAVDVAIRHGLPHGGWCPKGRAAEDGPIGFQYQLNETPSASCRQCAEWNVRDSDGTVVFSLAAKMTVDSFRTVDFAEKHARPCIHVTGTEYGPALRLQEFVSQHRIRVLNVAGSSESEEPGLWRSVYQVIDDAFFWSTSHPGQFGGPGEG